jgi:hypothetical protein
VTNAKKLDPYDVEALERAVNDSATRVSAIWISFLVFSLYLLIAATTVTQRQLLLAEPVKLPALNIDLPQWGFFFLAPVLFVVLHSYVLLQVLLLGRTTAAYNAAVARADLSPEESASLRQRLANTLFAQIFAGSPRERKGFIGASLRVIVWITLAIGPVVILLAFQFSFLAYHSHLATWTHRLLILFELVAFFLIWPLALDAEKDFQWPNVGADIKRLLSIPVHMFGPMEMRHNGWMWLRERAISLLTCVLFVLVFVVDSDVSRRAACQPLYRATTNLGAMRAMAPSKFWLRRFEIRSSGPGEWLLRRRREGSQDCKDHFREKVGAVVG